MIYTDEHFGFKGLTSYRNCFPKDTKEKDEVSKGHFGGSSFEIPSEAEPTSVSKPFKSQFGSMPGSTDSHWVSLIKDNLVSRKPNKVVKFEFSK
ncbi:hypothetical protein Leryth_026964 [Lithospermum erythrorhizon]|nr:hypothetical protein Leryth_026964 [Lithospermum erythrorhizon]